MLLLRGSEFFYKASALVLYLFLHDRYVAETFLFFGSVFVFFFFSSRATPMACGSSQHRVRIETVAASQCHSHSNAGSEPHLTYTMIHSNAGPLTHWVRPRIEPVSSWILIVPVTTEPRRELLFCFCHAPSMQKFRGQGSNPHQSSEPSQCSDKTGSLTCRATRELQASFTFQNMFTCYLTWSTQQLRL